MTIKAIDSLAPRPVAMEGASDVSMRMLIGPQDGAATFHMRHFELQPGGHTPHHSHDYEHEVLVLKGRLLACSDAGEQEVGPRSVVWVPANETHQFRNPFDEPAEFICLIPAPRCCC